MAPKRKNVFHSDFEKIDGIKRSKKGDGFFYCEYCQDDMNLEALVERRLSIYLFTGVIFDAESDSDIHFYLLRPLTSLSVADVKIFPVNSSKNEFHEKTTKHLSAVRTKARNQTITSFMPNQTSPTSSDYKVAAAEGCWAYHTIRHHQSFASSDCVNFKTSVVTLPSHAPTRWTTLSKIINRILLKWHPLKQLFSSEDKPRILREFFQSELSEPICNFLQSVLNVFDGPIMELQRSDFSLPDLLDIMSGFKSKIEERLSRKFYGATTRFRMLSAEQAIKLQSDFNNFYQIVIGYIERWFQLRSLPQHISWVRLNDREVDFQGQVLPLAEQMCPELALKDALFDEVSMLNKSLKEIPENISSELTMGEKWKRIFGSTNTPQSFQNLYKLVSAVLSIPVSNAFVERVFSLANVQWTKERNSLSVETVKSLLLASVNIDLSCVEMHSKLLGDRKLLEKILSVEKYH